MFLLHASMLSAVDIQYVFGVTSKGYLGGVRHVIKRDM